MEKYETFGHYNFLGEIIVIGAFILFFVIGIYNLYYLGGVVRENLPVVDFTGYSAYVELAKDYAPEVIGIVVAIYLISLGIGYLIVRLFSNLAGLLMYGSLFLQLGLFAVLYWKVDWEYNWIFLIPTIPNILILTIWHGRFRDAINYLKLSSMAVYKERKLLIPQFTQTLMIMALVFFYLASMFAIYFDVTPGTIEIYIRETKIDLDTNAKVAGLTILYVFLTYITYYVTLGLKMQMIHYWFRGGSCQFRKGFKIVQHRWMAIAGYATLSTIIHMLQYAKKIINGEFAPTSTKDILKMAKVVKPQSEAELNQKGPWYERLWLGLNYYTINSIILENKSFPGGLFRSLQIISKNIPDLYIKKSHVNALFKFLQYMVVVGIALGGAVAGGVFGYLFELDVRYSVGVGMFLFLVFGAGTSTLILNDLNTAYKTIMYIHTIDKMNGRDGWNYTGESLPEKLEDQYNMDEIIQEVEQEEQEKLDKKAQKKAKKEAEKQAEKAKKKK